MIHLHISTELKIKRNIIHTFFILIIESNRHHREKAAKSCRGFLLDSFASSRRSALYLEVDRTATFLHSLIQLLLHFLLIGLVDGDVEAAVDLASVKYFIDLGFRVRRDLLEGALHVVVAEVALEDFAGAAI